SPCLLVLNTGTSQSRQHNMRLFEVDSGRNRYPIDTSLIHIESHKSPTAELFEVDSGRIFIRHYGMLKSITLNVLAELHG
ncbi:hypothetical protein Tco_0186758, partial [Tanacetum coccineum]